MIQSIITRQAANGFLVKGWALTVAAAFYGYVVTHPTWEAAATSLLPSIGFFYLDAFHLRQERLFRALWDDVIGPNSAVDLFNLNVVSYKQNRRCRWGSVLFRSPHLWGTYGAVFTVGVLLLIYAVSQ